MNFPNIKNITSLIYPIKFPFTKVSLIILLTTIFSSCLYAFTDTLNKTTHPDSIVVSLNLTQINESEEINPQIINIFDSLTLSKFFTAHDSIKSIDLNSKVEIPVFSDSVLEKRIADLNYLSLFEIPYNKQVKNYIEFYSIKNRDLYSKIMGLSALYFPLFEEHLDKYNLPLELKYLAIVESALNPTANSRAGAKGLWQFMYGTGKMYGLKSTTMVDDRFDPVKSTDAACRHLKDLHEIYDNWALALAAYNSGPGNVNKLFLSPF